MLNIIKRKKAMGLFCIMLLVGFTNSGLAIGTSTKEGVIDYEIKNPYESVDWNLYGQYKACLHMHTTEFDGFQSAREMLEECYKKGYDIAAITDHNITNTTWDRTDTNIESYLTTERLNEINSGIGRDGRGMTGIPFTTEQSVRGHVNTYWANFSESIDISIESKIAKCEELGGISHINHPGGDANSSQCFEGDQITEIGAQYIDEYTRIFLKYPSCVGIEAFNANYGNRESFRRLWDHILMNTMPKRPVWGFSSDDAHWMSAIGFDFEMMLMPKNTEENVRHSMENGTFYIVSAATNTETFSDRQIQSVYPIISNIVVNQNENSITITGKNYDVIEWIADGKVIAFGESIDLNDHEGEVVNYIRAQLKGKDGISSTQPFGIIDNSTIIGDIDGSGVVNAIDYALLRKHLLGMSECMLTAKQVSIADVDGNGALNSVDFAYMRKYLLCMISSFPIK